MIKLSFTTRRISRAQWKTIWRQLRIIKARGGDGGRGPPDLRHRIFADRAGRAGFYPAGASVERCHPFVGAAAVSDLATICRIFQGSNGDATRMLYRDLEAFGQVGVIAVNLFRACKCSERAKLYRKGPGYKTAAYERKDWSIKNLAAALRAQRGDQLLDMQWGWAIDQDLRDRGDPHHHILYVEPPTGQVSFHVGERYDGPDFAGQWDGAKGTAAERICRFVVEVFKHGALAG
jgi:hypothetical protein